ncbi:phosphatidylinositol-glycan biosynthesis class F protein isoform X2 [Gallus gallus]|uniref:phosphatidylinositol-glycan biosynthesis class F protein isoform X2 n=1 Tax=Gallus gallus TaxID=9031 RepID=UPI001AE7F208|nr:phosphatidylinositol-glycan biosynthesis class F protein isoform X2 [Gallus gallus]
MKEAELRRLLAANLLCAGSIVLTALVPALFLDGFSVLGTHLTWLCICSVCVSVLNVTLCLILKPSPSSKRSSLSNKISRFLKCCIYFFMSCILFHAIIVLYGAPLIESVTETFLFAVLLSTFTTLQCLCLLGPNIQAWIRVFSRNGAMSIWENSLQITTTCSILGGWFGAFPIPLDWDRPWQIDYFRLMVQ